jgi:osmotically inducible protein OsmC
MNRLALIEIRLLSNPFVAVEISVVAAPREGIGGTGRRAVPLTAVLEFLLAGSRAGRWPRRRDRAEARMLGTLQTTRKGSSVIEQTNVLYTAEATAMGGREGHARTSDGRVDVDLDVPTEMGGTGGPGTNPEQLFAVGYAACFQSALLRFAAGRELDLSDSRVTARVGIGPVPSGGFGLVAALDLDAPRLTRDVAVDLMNRAHAACPYSRATRGNVEVTLTLGGATIERHAA